MNASDGSASAPNPFDDDNSRFLVLANNEGQHSLWPEFAMVPDGWTVLLGASARNEAVDYVEKNWTDMRPASLVRAVGSADGPGREL